MTDTPEDDNTKNNDEATPIENPIADQERPQMSITSDEVNYLVFRYLQESGYVHSAFSFAHESILGSTGLRSADKTMPPGALVTFLQKGLQYVGIEERLRLEGVEKGQQGDNKEKEGANKKHASSASATPPEFSEFSLLSQSAMSAIARRDPPLQLNVPPATAAAAIKARLQAQAEMEAERNAAASIVAIPMQQPNLTAAPLIVFGNGLDPQRQHQQQLPGSSPTTGGAHSTASVSTKLSAPLTTTTETLPTSSPSARHQQAMAALQLHQQQLQYATVGEQRSAAAGAAGPLANLSSSFVPRTATDDFLPLSPGAAPQQIGDASTLADVLATQEQQQQQHVPTIGAASTTAAASMSQASQPPQKETKQPKQHATSGSSSSMTTGAKHRGSASGSGGTTPGTSSGPKRGNKRQKLHSNEEVRRISETIAGLAAAQHQQGLSEMAELQSKNNSNGNNRGSTNAPHVPSNPNGMEIEQAIQHQPKEQQQQQHPQVDFRKSAQQQQQQPVNMVGHQQEFRPIHQVGQEQQQVLNGQRVVSNFSVVGNGKLIIPSEHRSGGLRGSGGGAINGTDNMGGTNNRNLVVSRTEARESPNSNTEDLEMDTPQDHILKLEMHESEVFMCAWNPVFTNLIATGSGDASARIWQVGGTKASAGLTTVKLLPHGVDQGDRKNKDVTTLEWSSDGTLLATGSYDGVARVWARNGALIHTLTCHTGPIFSLKWNKQGNYLLSGSYDKTTIVWDVAGSRGYVEQQFTEHKAPALDVDWKDNTTFASCSTDRSVHICRVGVSRPLKVYVGHSDEVNAVKWDPSGHLLASCSDDCTAKIWDVESDRTDPLYDLKSHEQEIYTVKWSPTGPGSRHPNKRAILATASFDGSVRLWNVADGSCYRVFNKHKDSVYSVAFSPSGDYLASGSLAGQMYVWDIEQAKHIRSYKGKGDIFEVAWNKEETRVAACFSSNVVAIIDFDKPPP